MKNGKRRIEAVALPLVRATPNYELPASAVERWNPQVRAVAGAAPEGDAVISINGIIGRPGFWDDGGSENTVRRIGAELRSIGKKPVTVHLHSPGGDFFEGIGIMNLLSEHPELVTIKVLGLAASAASVIAMAGDTLMVPRAGFMMIHNTQAIAIGDRNDMREMAAFLAPFDEVIASIYAACTGIEIKQIAGMMDRETWLGGEAAVEKGFADQLLPSDQVDVAAALPESVAAQAAHKLDVILAKQGLPRAERRALIKAIKNTGASTPGAAPAPAEEPATPSAGSSDLAEAIRLLQSIVVT